MSLAAALASALGRDVAALRRAGGGDINDAYVAELAGGGRAFVKTRRAPAPGEYALEAAGLRWLAEPAALRVPEVLAATDQLLALEWIDTGPRYDDEALGRGLALTHAAGAPAHGALPPRDTASDASRDDCSEQLTPKGSDPFGDALRIGPVEMPGVQGRWARVYAEGRLAPLVEQAGLSARGAAAVERVCERMEELAGPEEEPARLHGDLWSGNVMADADGRPVLIDPAAYGGHREVDLAMLQLFGSPSPRLFAAYEDVAPLADGWRERVELWQLFPLLVHAVLFGGGYRASAERAAAALAP